MTDLRTAAIEAAVTASAARQAADGHTTHCPRCTDGIGLGCLQGKPLEVAYLRAASAARDALLAYAPPGTTATYHGSVTSAHGPGWTVTRVTPDGCRYVLTRGEEQLRGASVESITPA